MWWELSSGSDDLRSEFKAMGCLGLIVMSSHLICIEHRDKSASAGAICPCRLEKFAQRIGVEQLVVREEMADCDCQSFERGR